MLDRIFTMQRELNNEIILNHKDKAHEYTVPNICRALIHEACELEDEYNWKWWKQDKVVDREKALEETVDIFHFFVCLCLKQGINPEDLYQAYILKNKENLNRQEGIVEGREDYASIKINKGE